MSQPAVPTTIYQARSILTMNRPDRAPPTWRCATTLGVGGLDELKTWGPAELDRRYADQVLMPGLVEGHCHLPEGGMWVRAWVTIVVVRMADLDRAQELRGGGGAAARSRGRPGSRASRRWRRGCAKPRPRCPRTGR